MIRNVCRLAAAVAVAGMTARGAAAQAGDSARARPAAPRIGVSFKGRFQAEFRTSDVRSTNADGTPATVNTVMSNEFFVRRLYLEAVGRPAPGVQVKLEVNATRRAVNLEDAWAEIALGPWLTWRAGQEKKPVERQEILSSSLYPTVERGAQVAGLRNPNLVSENNFLTAAGFTGHDVGTSVELHNGEHATMPVSLRVGVWTGQGKDNPEVNNAKTFGARLQVTPVRDWISFGASFVSHDDPISVPTGVGSTRAIAADSAGRSHAFGLDAELGAAAPDSALTRGGFRDRIHVLADASLGREGHAGALTSMLAGLRASPPAAATFEPRFWTVHVAGEYRVTPRNMGALKAVGPVFRVDHTVPDTGGDVSSTLLTPGVNLYFARNAWVMFNYDVMLPGDGLDLGRGPGEPVHSFKSMLRVFF